MSRQGIRHLPRERGFSLPSSGCRTCTCASIPSHRKHRHRRLTPSRPRRRRPNGHRRYLAAFERGTLPEEICGLRLDTLRTEHTQLRAREQQLRPALTSNNKPQATVRDLGSRVDMTSQHANRPLHVQGPTIGLWPVSTESADRLSTLSRQSAVG